MSAKLAFLASGGGSNFEAIVRACAGGILDGVAAPSLLVVNRADAGALARASRLGVPSRVVAHADFAARRDHEAAVLSALRAAAPDLVVLAGYMRILSGDFLAAVGAPVLNIHPVPTYVYQGAHGYEHAFAHRAALGASFPTIHAVDVGVDTGRPILYGAPYALAELSTLVALRARGLVEEHLAFPLALRCLLRGDVDDPRVDFTQRVLAWLSGTGPRPGLAGVLAPPRSAES